MSVQAAPSTAAFERTGTHMNTRWLEWGSVVAILAVALVLRLVNLGDNPGWYTDEATHIDIVQHLLRGDYGYMVLSDSPLIVSRMPLFHLLLLPIYAVVGTENGMATLRTVTALLGVCSVGILYLVVRHHSLALALVAAGTLAIMPQAVLYNRLAYSYNLLAPLILLMFYCLTRYFEGINWRWLATSALLMGLSLISDIIAITFLVVYGLLLIRRPRALLLSLPLIALPFAFYAAVMLMDAPDAWLFDMQHIINRLRLSAPITRQLEFLIPNIALWVIKPWWFVGMVGVFLLPRQVRLSAIAFLWLPFLSVGRSNSFLDLGAYYAIPMLPFLALGVGGFAIWLSKRGKGWLQKHLPQTRVSKLLISYGVATLLLGLPAAWTVANNLNALAEGFDTAIDPFLMPADVVRQVAAYVNAHSAPDDVIVTTPTVGWLLNGRAIDFEMVPALLNGVATPHLPALIPPERAAFDPDYRNARFVIIDDTWRLWGRDNVPGLADVMDDVETNWQIASQVGSYSIYEQR